MAKRSKYVNGSKRIRFRKLGSFRWGIVDTWDLNGRTHKATPVVLIEKQKRNFTGTRPYVITAVRHPQVEIPRTKWLYEARELAMQWAEDRYSDDLYSYAYGDEWTEQGVTE